MKPKNRKQNCFCKNHELKRKHETVFVNVWNKHEHKTVFVNVWKTKTQNGVCYTHELKEHKTRNFL